MRNRALRMLIYFVAAVGGLYLLFVLVVWTVVDRRIVHTVNVRFDWDQAKGFKEIKGVLPAVAYPLVPQALPYIASELRRQRLKSAEGWCAVNVLGGVVVLGLNVWAGCRLNDPEVTPLMHAAEDGDVASVEKLLAGHADPNAQDQHGWTALMHASFKYRDNPLVIRALLGSGADPDMKDRDGLNALHWASRNCQPGIAAALVKGGVDLSQYGQGALYLASYARCTKVVHLLEEAGVTP